MLSYHHKRGNTPHRLGKYLTDRMEGAAEVLTGNGCYFHDLELMTEDFRERATLNPRVTKYIGHLSVSFDAVDKFDTDGRLRLTNDYMTELAEEYLDRLLDKLYEGEETKPDRNELQYVVVRHNDTDNPHFHVMYNCVLNNGKRLNSGLEGYKGKQVATEMRQQHAFTLSENKKPRQIPENLEGNEISIATAKQHAHYHISLALQSAENMEDFKDMLRSENIAVNEVRKSRTQEIQGLNFEISITDNSGIIHQNNLSGSQIDQKFGYKKLLRQFEKNRNCVTKQNTKPLKIGNVVYNITVADWGRFMQGEEVKVTNNLSVLKEGDKMKIMRKVFREKHMESNTKQINDSSSIDSGGFESIGKNDLSGGRRNETVVDNSDKKKPKKKPVVYRI